MSEGSGKLAETLASSIVDKMTELANKGRVEGDWVKNSDNMFGTMFDVLQAVAENSYNARMLSDSTDATLNAKQIEDRASFKELNDFIKEEVVERLKHIEAQRKDTKGNNEPSKSDLGISTESGDTDETEGEDVRGKHTIQRSISRLEKGQNKIIKSVENLQKDNRHIKTNMDDSERRSRKHLIKMERSIKHTIKSRMGKLWSMFKKTLIIGLLLFFPPILKRAFGKLADLLSPVTEWFKINFPSLYEYIKDLSRYVGSIASDFKFLVDKIKFALDWIDEHETGVKVGAGAASGALAGAAIGSVIPGVGTAVGAAIGAGVGAIGGGIDAKMSQSEKEYEKETAERQEVMAKYDVDRMIKNGELDGSDEAAVEAATAERLNEIQEYEKTVPTTNLDMSVRKDGEGFGSMFKRKWREMFRDTGSATTPKVSTTAPTPTETAADALEGSLNGQTEVEPNDDEAKALSAAYQIINETNINNLYVKQSATLWG
jgi:Outer membrane lipoprotein